VFVDERLMAQIRGGNCYPLDHDPAVLAGGKPGAHCVSRVNWQLQEVEVHAASAVAQNALDPASHVGGGLAALGRSLAPVAAVAPESLAEIGCLADIDAVPVLGAEPYQIDARIIRRLGKLTVSSSSVADPSRCHRSSVAATPEARGQTS
jgi:hypothetical protein